ncbi:iron-containing alcohol dehydrogenase [Sulfitobacter sp. HNIBRBA3233]|uniref:iron-containing alcohol dehydrogenase n=1 Tax=Sulfitobacter marinivivus TaxID=3158558 RepID=UPI0032DFBB9B
MERVFGINTPTAIRFGTGVAGQVAEVLPRGTTRVALVRGRSGAADPVAAALAAEGISIDTVIASGEPSVASVNAAMRGLGWGVQAVVACGGGSVIDTGKALAFLVARGRALDDDFDTIAAEILAQAPEIPCIALPTTAGTGAEVTANAVLDVPSRRAKISLRGLAITPTHALVDPELMQGAPRSVVLQSGLDAICQVIEAYTSALATPYTDALTRAAIPVGLRALPQVVETGSAAAWQDMAWVSTASGLALANGGLGAAHGLASVVGGDFAAPHGGLCGRFLLPTLRLTAAHAAGGSAARVRTEAVNAMIADAFAPTVSDDPLSGFAAWIDSASLARLGDWGVTPDDHARLAQAAPDASSSRKGALPLPVEAFERMLADAQ